MYLEKVNFELKKLKPFKITQVQFKINQYHFEIVQHQFEII